MMAGFRRAQLSGSDELFRPTQPGHQAHEASLPPPARTRPEPVESAPAPARPEGRLIRLTDDEIDVLADAVQRMKFPTSARPAVTKPSVDEFERLEDLRQKLLTAR